MYDWSGCPAGWFDLYMEVGAVRKVPVESDFVVEIWVASTFGRNTVREECKDRSRRPIYDVLKQIRSLCENEPAGVLFLSDDGRNDAVAWSAAVTLLIRQLKKEKLSAYTVLYTPDEAEITGELKNLSDVVVCGQSNPYQTGKIYTIKSKLPRLPDTLAQYLCSGK